MSNNSINILNITKKLKLKETIPIIIGCSAGPDSMALLHYLNNNLPNPIICCHINHNIRKESQKEENYLKKYCSNHNIPFESTTIKNYTQNNFENEARTKRYSFYKETLKKYNTKYLFLAHHGDDLIETILMKINRGSNLEGYAGIKEISSIDNFLIIRPFLSLTKEDLIKYNKKHNIDYFIDKTNYDKNYTRNRLRQNILPLLKEENPNIHRQFLKYSNTLLEYNYYINKETEKYLNQVYNNKFISINKFQKLDPFIQKNILYKILNKKYQNSPNIIKEQNIIDMIHLINNNKPNLEINLPQNILCLKEYNKLFFKQNSPKAEPYQIKIASPTETIEIETNTFIIKKIKNTNQNGNDICRLNSKNINFPLYIRTKQERDSIELLGSNYKKKVKDIFIDEKIPKTKREQYPILTDAQNNILWIPNIKKSKFNGKKEEFCDIILKYCEKEENDE